jgi:putative ATPase
MTARRPPTGQGSLFGAPAGADDVDRLHEARPDAPLAARMRPRSLDEVVGQAELLGEGSVLRRALDHGTLPSLVLWGPPGCGKTTLGRLLALRIGARFVPLSAVAAGVADLRREADAAGHALKSAGQRTVLFIDELHRFSKSQQDVVLPHVESGRFILIGATTENPGFSVNAALRSRCRVFRLEALADSDLALLVRRALADPDRGLGTLPLDLDEDALALLTRLSGGDARICLNALELAAAASDAGTDGRRRIRADAVRQALESPALRYDRAGDEHYAHASAFIKSVRGSDPDAAVYWLARMLESGEDPLFIVRRMLILAAEDVGLADPQALVVAAACQQAVHFVGMPEAHLALSECALYLALAPKSNSALTAFARARDEVRRSLNLPVPLHLRNAVTGVDRLMGAGRGYRYAHDFPDGVAVQEHLPEGIGERRFYTAGPRGFEARAAARLAAIRARGSEGGPAEPVDDGA